MPTPENLKAAQEFLEEWGCPGETGPGPRVALATLLDTIEAQARKKGLEEAVKCVRFEKYQNRGEGLPDSDPHSDDNPDYIREAVDEGLEYAVARIERAALQREEGGE